MHELCRTTGFPGSNSVADAHPPRYYGRRSSACAVLSSCAISIPSRLASVDAASCEIRSFSSDCRRNSYQPCNFMTFWSLCVGLCVTQLFQYLHRATLCIYRDVQHHRRITWHHRQCTATPSLDSHYEQTGQYCSPVACRPRRTHGDSILYRSCESPDACSTGCCC